MRRLYTACAVGLLACLAAAREADPLAEVHAITDAVQALLAAAGVAADANATEQARDLAQRIETVLSCSSAPDGGAVDEGVEMPRTYDEALAAFDAGTHPMQRALDPISEGSATNGLNDNGLNDALDRERRRRRRAEVRFSTRARTQ